MLTALRNLFTSASKLTPAQPTMSKLKVAKGMRDIPPSQGWLRKRVFNSITDIFEKHGGQPLDTPDCELRELLVGKYGEEAKLIYNCEDQGGELLSLRYDLTVPFARYLAMNKISEMIRYSIGKVHRRDNPSIVQGRFREFYQCDIDFAGKYAPMMPDTECLQILCEILQAVNLPSGFVIKINHRMILDGMFELAGVPKSMFKTICSSVDKLDKMSWEDVKKEMCDEKKLDPLVADKIGEYVRKNGGPSLIEELKPDFGQNTNAAKGLEDLRILYEYAKEMEIDQYLSFDLSLARGLDYYTGLIYEAVLTGEDVEVGSVAAGGRYDNLVNSLVDNNFNVPCVGLSIGIERLFVILEANNEPEVGVQCCVGSVGQGLMKHRIKILRELRAKGLRVKCFPEESCKPLQFFQKCERDNIPYTVFFGAKEMEKNMVNLRSVKDRSEASLEVDQLAVELKKRLGLSDETENDNNKT